LTFSSFHVIISYWWRYSLSTCPSSSTWVAQNS